ncbi:MAG: hypothetical protein ABI638_07130 [Ignavibacteriota bacterium]
MSNKTQIVSLTNLNNFFYKSSTDCSITKVTDRMVKQEQHKKYLEIYKKNFEEELDGTIKIDRD